jgi:hypothetical protein
LSRKPVRSQRDTYIFIVPDCKLKVQETLQLERG